ncbi:unnamed protein product [Rhizophagus irregularis]|nr:unnamed protein product [Rhizophagus irregularis]
MSATQYYEEVRPFKKILPKKLREDIKAFYILSNNVPPPDALPPRRLFRHETILKRQHQMRDRINQHYTPRHSMIVDIFDRNNITPTPVPPEAPPYTLGKHKNISDHDIKIKYHDFFSVERENSPILNIADFSSVLINKNQAKRIGWEGIDDIILSRIKNPCAAIFDGDNQYDVGFSSDLQLFMGTYERNNYEKKIMEENQFRMIDYEVFLVKRVNKNDRIG